MQRRCLMAAANVHFTEYVNVFLPSSKVSADVAHRTFAGAQPAARSRPQPSEPDTARQPQGLLRQPSISRNSRRKLSCALPGLRLRQLHQPAESLGAARPPDPAEKFADPGQSRKTARICESCSRCLPRVYSQKAQVFSITVADFCSYVNTCDIENSYLCDRESSS